MCPSESEIFDSVLDNAVELDGAGRAGRGRVALRMLIFLPRLLIGFIIAPFRWFWRQSG